MQIIWDDKAIEDLAMIYNYLLTKNERAATELYNSIVDEANILLRFPQIAPIQTLTRKLDFQIRGLLTKNRIYKIMYFIDGNIIFITQI